MKNKTIYLLVISFIVFLFWFLKDPIEIENVRSKNDQQELKKDASAAAKTLVDEKDEKNESEAKKTHPHKFESINKVVRDLKRIDACSRTRDCYKEDDPKDYSVQVSRQLTLSLKDLNHRVRSQGIKNNKITRIGKKFLSYQGDELKLEALKLLDSQKLGSKMIDPIFDEVLSSPHPQSTQFAIELLSKLDSPAEQRQINNKLYGLMTHGGIYPALEVVRNLDIFLKDENRPYFEKALADIGKQRVSEKLYDELKKKLEL